VPGQIILDFPEIFMGGLWLTMQISGLGLIGALLLGIVVALFRISPLAPLRWIGAGYVEFFRNTPLLVQLFFLFFGLPVLGICLGAQLIAAALGARVYPGPQKEIGWYAVEVTTPGDDFAAGLPARFMAFHWHGDTFDLPPGATRLFRSDVYENQGFRWGRNVCAIQFHMEINAAMVDEWLADGGCQRELTAVPDVNPEIIRQQTAQWAEELEKLCAKVFGRFIGRFPQLE